jgi:hypothetical protein
LASGHQITATTPDLRISPSRDERQGHCAAAADERVEWVRAEAQLVGEKDLPAVASNG